MADDKDKFGDEEEFQFSDSSSSDYETSTALPSSEGSNLRRYALIGVGLLILVLAVYKMLGLFTGQPNIAKAPDAVPQAFQPQSQQQPDPVQFAPPVQPVAQPAVSEDVNRRIASLEVVSQNNRNQLTQVTNNLTAMNNKLDNLEQKLSMLAGTLDKFSDDIDSIRSQMVAVKARAYRAKTVEKTTTSVKQSERRAGYHIQAIIPGRAWLSAPEGKTLTVREGSRVPGHGVVRMIDPHQGLVKTSSGDIIRFSPNDS